MYFICILEIRCGPVPDMAGLGNMIVDDFYNEYFNFTCLPSFRIEGNSSVGNTIVRCMSNGHWDLGDLTCEGRYIDKRFYFNMS